MQRLNRRRRSVQVSLGRSRFVPRPTLQAIITWMAIAASLSSQTCRSDVVVLANRTSQQITAAIKPIFTREQNVQVAAGDSIPVFIDGRPLIRFDSGRGVREYRLDANAAYYFGTLPDGSTGMQKIGLGDSSATNDGRSLPGTASAAPAAILPVVLLVDEEEAAQPSIWQRRLKARVNKASDILEKHCRLKLRIVAFATWNSDNNTTDFFDSLREFEREVKPQLAKLAIGFTSQYQVPTGRVHLGGTRGAFHSHILIREWSKHVGEPERLEILVHELGHLLGASHSPEKDSVMRPVLGDRLSLRANFRIRFDPVNTLVMSMIVEEMRRRNVQELGELSPGSKKRLTEIYGVLAKAFPDDTSAKQFLRHVNVTTVSPLVKSTRRVLGSIVRAARQQSNEARAFARGETEEPPPSDDLLTQHYVRVAAQSALEVPEDIAEKAFLLALGIGLDHTDTLQKLPTTRSFARSIESAGQRTVRVAFLGKPTMRQRRDLAQHFFVSSYLTTIRGSKQAEAAGIAKEVLDASGGTGFSFADLAADKAGIFFAGALLNKKISLEKVAEHFTVPAYLPPIDDLPEGLPASQFLAQYGGREGSKFRQQVEQIDLRILQLPAYILSE